MDRGNVTRLIKRLFGYRGDDYYEKYQRLSQQFNYLREHVDAKNLKKAVGYERHKQLELVKFTANYLDSIEDANIRPFLIAGSLVGQYRHNGFVPWDDDIDFGLMRADYEHFVDYCKCRYPYFIYDEADGNLQGWIDKCTRSNVGEYILFIYDNQIQVSCGTNALDRKCIDFFSFDYYSDKVSFRQYNQYLLDVKGKLDNVHGSVKERYKIVRKELETRKFWVEHSDRIYFGLDDMESFKRMFNEDWIDENVLFPLIKRKFEGYEFWTPYDEKKFLTYEYPDFENIPDDIGIKTHNYWDEYKINNYINVEFYLVDAFEIQNLIPFYRLFRAAGIYAIFVAEPPAINVAGSWFDYDAAVKILKANCIEYKEKCNSRAQMAFTTQDVVNLSKYSKETKRVNCSYGYGLIRNSYAFSERVVNGFDYTLCNGDYQKRILQKWCSGKTELITVGMPKYYGISLMEKSETLKKLEIKTNKDILLYFPTWDECCCVEHFYESFKKLRETFYIITKMHHVLERQAQSKNIRMMIKDFSDQIVESTYPLSDLAMIADLIVADAKSGASLEAIYINNTADAIFLSNATDVDSVYMEQIHDIAPVVTSEHEFVNAINKSDWEVFKLKRKKLIEDCYGNKSVDYANKFVNKLLVRMREDEKSR